MIILMTAAIAAAQPAPASGMAPTHAQHQQMQHKGPMSHSGRMGHMGNMGHMSGKQMAECRKCCEEMMAKMHHGHTQHQGHAG